MYTKHQENANFLDLVQGEPRKVICNTQKQLYNKNLCLGSEPNKNYSSRRFPG